MSFLANPLTRSLRSSALPRSAFTASRALHFSAPRRALNESDRGRDDLDTEIENHKNDGLQKQKDGKGHWKGELASNSEAALKADKNEVEASEEQIKQMQEETKKLMNEKSD